MCSILGPHHANIIDLHQKCTAQACARVQTMQPSNVSGGFWLQNPQAVTDNLGTDKRGIDLECLEPCQHQDEYKLGVDGSQTRWSVVYLPRKSGSGMSGGWIHFAIDHVRFAATAPELTRTLLTLVFCLFNPISMLGHAARRCKKKLTHGHASYAHCLCAPSQFTVRQTSDKWPRKHAGPACMHRPVEFMCACFVLVFHWQSHCCL